MNLAIDDQHRRTLLSRGYGATNWVCRASALLETRNRRILDRASKEETMPRIKHIALTTKEPAKVAAFYKDAFDMQEIRRAPNGAVFLTDGYINLAILNWKTEKSADVGANGPNYSGIHHFGFEVEDLDEAAAKLGRAEGQHLEEKAGLDTEMAAGGHRNFEMKWAGPDGVVIDISHTGWETKTR
jgi:catechol 2,3-dioxygenase-like lactoylglutathione lyase family enzyme